jgi:hypothetical protein
MKKWFECGVSSEKEMEDGKVKKVKEMFLIDAMSFTEAETRIVECVKELISGDFELETVKKENISELFRNEPAGGTWFKTKVSFVSLDEVNGKEKRTKVVMYVQCLDINDVMDKLKLELKGTVSDYEVNSIIETKILDVFDLDLSK